MGAQCCAEKARPDKMGLIMALRVFGGILAAFSIVEFGLGTAVYLYFTNVQLGAWWGAILTFVAGILGLFPKNKGAVIAGIVIGIIGMIVAAVGSTVDGIAALIFASEVTCISKTGVISGDTAYSSQVLICGVFGTLYDCSCMSAPSSGSQMCYFYNGHSDCGDILTSYTSMLKAASAINALLAVACFIFTILACSSACSCCSDTAIVHSIPQVEAKPVNEYRPANEYN